MLEVFFDYEGIIHYEFKAKLLIKNFNWRFLRTTRCNQTKKPWKMGKKRLVSFTPQCSTIALWSWEITLLKIQCYHFETPSLFLRPSTSGFYLSLRLKKKSKRHRLKVLLQEESKSLQIPSVSMLSFGSGESLGKSAIILCSRNKASRQ